VRERVFDRFVRGDEARHGSSSGLGLAIAAENARLLGGTLTLDADGRTFRLTLPA
jgi:two-component system sensor histidine kinase MtrB